MQPEQSFGGAAQNPGNGSVLCTQCGAPMPGDMRFCRACGNRLGEGSAEYTETVRLGSAPAGSRMTSPFIPGMSAPIANRPTSTFMKKRRLGLTGMTWMWIALGLFFASGGLMSAFVKPVTRFGGRTTITASAPRSYFGIDGFENADGGVTFDEAKPPGGPADKAGLVGGDIITSFDGHVVKNEDDVMTALRATPIGKTVEVLYQRDGQPKKTLLTTVSEGELERLGEVFNDGPRGLFGYEESDSKRVLIPQTGTYGVQLDNLTTNGPADIAGIKEGDIIVEFDKIPIRTTGEMLSRVRRAVPRSIVTLKVMRDGQLVDVPVKMGVNN